MTRWLAVVSAVVLSAVLALQVRAHELDDGSGMVCAEGYQQICKVETTTRCLKWTVTTGTGGIGSGGITTTVKYTCEQETTTERTWYYT